MQFDGMIPPIFLFRTKVRFFYIKGVLMSRQIQIRRGSAAENDAFTGAIGEITMDTTNKTQRVHDGETAGGIKLARQDEITDSFAPSSRYTNLSLGPSGTSYTAPADGYVSLAKEAGTSGAFFNLFNLTKCIGITSDGFQPGTKFLWIPVAKGDEFTVSYSFSGTTTFFRFVYAKNAL